MLFGAATAYQEYPSGYDQVRERYAAFLRDIEENGLPVVVASNSIYSNPEDY
jgi:effector-binding domain-containing protein